MSERHTELAEGKAVVVARTPNLSFAERYVAAGFYLPDQKQMRRMMNKACWDLAWDTSGIHAFIQRCLKGFNGRKSFKAFTLKDYLKLEDFSWGAPIPDVIRARIDRVRQKFPHAEIRIYALPGDDPFVGFVEDGDLILTDAWVRKNNEVFAIYPPAT